LYVLKLTANQNEMTKDSCHQEVGQNFFRVAYEVTRRKISMPPSAVISRGKNESRNKVEFHAVRSI